MADEYIRYPASSGGGSGITDLTGDVSATGPGSAAATVNAVGGSTAANVHTAEVAANAATDANTASTIVKRDASGNFAAGTITADLVGNVTGNADTATHATTADSATTATSATTAGNVSGTVAIANGGTGQTTANDALNALLPSQTGNNGKVLQSDGTNASWVTNGNGITDLTGDVTATGPGSAAATVASVGGSTAADVHTAEVAANAATDVNTVSTIVKRDASGNFAAGTITADLIGNVAGNASTATTAGSATTAGNVTGTVAITNGGTGQTSKSAAFDALSPMTTSGDVVYGGASGTGTRLAGNTSTTKKFLTQTGSGSASAAPAWGTIAGADVPIAVPGTSPGVISASGVPGNTTGSSITAGYVGETLTGTLSVSYNASTTEADTGMTLALAKGVYLVTYSCLTEMLNSAAGGTATLQFFTVFTDASNAHVPGSIYNGVISQFPNGQSIDIHFNRTFPLIVTSAQTYKVRAWKDNSNAGMIVVASGAEQYTNIVAFRVA